MSSSFEKINYTLRPNKCVERKMMCEALGRLAFVEPLENYRYIGFGSPYFADFALFHRNLGINDLISIEKEESKKSRFEFNIPFSAIKMKYGLSTTVLPNLELGKRKNIIWLDYDDKLSDFMFADIDTVFANAAAGSFFIISVNVEQEFQKLSDIGATRQTEKEFRLQKLIERVGQSRIPMEFLSVNFNTKNLSEVSYEMINRQIARTLVNRNGAKRRDKLYYQQILNFEYKDNAAILTVGGIIYSSVEKRKFQQMAFQKLPFYMSKNVNFRINCPHLTAREIKALDRALPASLEVEKGKFKNEVLKKIPLSITDIKNYAEIYRYYPNFAETII